jgi:hypothetical protein
MRRLLSLDYVLEHRELDWLPTEREKLDACGTRTSGWRSGTPRIGERPGGLLAETGMIAAES